MISQTTIETFPRHGLIRLVTHTQDPELYEAARKELDRRDTEGLRQLWIRVMTGEK